MKISLAQIDLAQAGAILADMVAAYLDASPPLIAEEKADEHDPVEDRPEPSGTAGMHLHPTVDANAGAVPSREHGASVQSDKQGSNLRMGAGSDSCSRRRSRPVGLISNQPRRLQSAGQRCRPGPCGRDLLPGSVASGALEPGLAPASGALRRHQYSRIRRGRL